MQKTFYKVADFVTWLRNGQLKLAPDWNDLLSEIIVLPFDSKAAHTAVYIQRNLKALRRSIEKADLFIAATAVSNELTLDTLNIRHFIDIDHLKLLST